jgi:hypothetical protein
MKFYILFYFSQLNVAVLWMSWKIYGEYRDSQDYSLENLKKQAKEGDQFYTMYRIVYMENAHNTEQMLALVLLVLCLILFLLKFLFTRILTKEKKQSPYRVMFCGENTFYDDNLFVEFIFINGEEFIAIYDINALTSLSVADIIKLQNKSKNTKTVITENDNVIFTY